MRLIRVLVPDDLYETVVDLLEEEDVDFVSHRVEADGETRWLVEFPVPTDAIGYLLDQLEDAGIDIDRYTTIGSLEAAMSPNLELLQDRFAGDFDPLTEPELRAKARNLSNDLLSFVVLIFLSAIIAAAGLLVDSPAVVVGAMVIAPIVGPVLTAAVGATTGDRGMLLASVWMQALGLAVAVVGAAAFAATVQYAGFVPSTLDITSIELIAVRVAPGLLTVVVGLSAGGAAAWGLVTKGPTSLIGVMIAAALIPAAATSGIAAVWNHPRVAVGSLLLLILTMIAINAAAFAVLSWFRYRPAADGWLLDPEDRRALLAVAATALAVIAVVGIVGAASAQQIAFERTVNAEVEAALDDPEYGSIDPVTVRIQYGGVGPFGEPETVTVVATRTDDGGEPPPVADELDRRITDATENDVVVRVRFVSYQESDGESQRAGSIRTEWPVASGPTGRPEFLSHAWN